MEEEKRQRIRGARRAEARQGVLWLGEACTFEPVPEEAGCLRLALSSLRARSHEARTVLGSLARLVAAGVQVQVVAQPADASPPSDVWAGTEATYTFPHAWLALLLWEEGACRLLMKDEQGRLQDTSAEAVRGTWLEVGGGTKVCVLDAPEDTLLMYSASHWREERRGCGFEGKLSGRALCVDVRGEGEGEGEPYRAELVACLPPLLLGRATELSRCLLHGVRRPPDDPSWRVRLATLPDEEFARFPKRVMARWAPDLIDAMQAAAVGHASLPRHVRLLPVGTARWEAIVALLPDQAGREYRRWGVPLGDRGVCVPCDAEGDAILLACRKHAVPPPSSCALPRLSFPCEEGGGEDEGGLPAVGCVYCARCEEGGRLVFLVGELTRQRIVASVPVPLDEAEERLGRCLGRTLHDRDALRAHLPRLARRLLDATPNAKDVGRCVLEVQLRRPCPIARPARLTRERAEEGDDLTVVEAALLLAACLRLGVGMDAHALIDQRQTGGGGGWWWGASPPCRCCPSPRRWRLAWRRSSRRWR